MAYAQLEPFGERQADWRAGMLASVLANLHRRKRGRRFKPEDFMPQDKSARGERSWQEQLLRVETLAARGMGTITTGKPENTG